MAGCLRPPPGGPGFIPSQAATLWEQVVAFAGYGFNQGHATAYADVSYRSAYLKAHWPAAFLCARLTGWGGFHHPAVYMAEAMRLGIAVRPPHVNYSDEHFTLTWERPEPAAGVQAAPVLWLGLGQVRDLRGSAVRSIIDERRGGAYEGLRDLLRRVALQPKEVLHLVRCGALDKLAGSRAALLVEAEDVRHAGSALQMAFAFAGPDVPAEMPAERLAWEQEILGLPVSVHPLELVREKLPAHTPLAELSPRPGHPATTAGVRLPGWTGGDGFFLGDGRTYIIVKTQKAAKTPPPWQPLVVRGRWAGDGWGTTWLQAESLTPVD